MEDTREFAERAAEPSDVTPMETCELSDGSVSEEGREAMPALRASPVSQSDGEAISV